jgi:hypothetical protein
MNPQAYQGDLGPSKPKNEKKQPSLSSFAKVLLLDFAAGTVAGGAGVLAGYPLDTIRVR